MPFNARIHRLLIASPGDVGEERKLVRQLAHRWNSANAVRRQVLLLPMGWELDSTPDMSAPGQEIINLELVAEADILVAVFWNRIGTPTARYESATVEEIEQHIDSGKKAMIYFCTAAVPRDKLDPTQLDGVERFKKRCTDRGLIGLPYASVSEFASTFQHDLDKEMNKSRYDHPGETFELNALATATLSESATALLLEIAKGDGAILVMRNIGVGGWMISVNRKQLPENPTPRAVATLKGALAELVERRLAEWTSNVVVQITDAGFDYADRLEASRPIRIEARVEGQPPDQFLRINSSRSITIDQLEYATTSGYAAAEQDVQETGNDFSVKISHTCATKLSNTHRSDMSHNDRSGPVQLIVRWTAGENSHTFSIASQLMPAMFRDPITGALTMFISIQGSTTFLATPS